jgi:hypothetical protein
MMTAHRLRREIRTASLLSNQANFATNELLTAGSQFSDTAFDPIEYFGALRERIPVECNKMVITPRGLRALRSNPILVESITSSGAGANARGRISKEAVAELLELEEIVVMGARTNTVELSNPLAPAPTVGLRRILGNVAALIRVDSSVRSATNDRMTWGMTATYQGMSVSKRFNDGIGARGVDELKLIENSKEIVAAPIAGVLIRNIHPAEATLSVDQLNAYAGQQYEGV